MDLSHFLLTSLFIVRALEVSVVNVVWPVPFNSFEYNPLSLGFLVYITVNLIMRVVKFEN